MPKGKSCVKVEAKVGPVPSPSGVTGARARVVTAVVTAVVVTVVASAPGRACREESPPLGGVQMIRHRSVSDGPPTGYEKSW